jgi:hypothetical protein
MWLLNRLLSLYAKNEPRAPKAVREHRALQVKSLFTLLMYLALMYFEIAFLWKIFPQQEYFSINKTKNYYPSAVAVSMLILLVLHTFAAIFEGKLLQRDYRDVDLGVQDNHTYGFVIGLFLSVLLCATAYFSLYAFITCITYFLYTLIDIGGMAVHIQWAREITGRKKRKRNVDSERVLRDESYYSYRRWMYLWVLRIAVIVAAGWLSIQGNEQWGYRLIILAILINEGVVNFWRFSVLGRGSGEP